jgi:hypothetical protein
VLSRERQINALVDAIFTSAPIGLAFVDRQLRFQRINARLAEMNGLPARAGRTQRLIVRKLDTDAVMERGAEQGRILTVTLCDGRGPIWDMMPDNLPARFLS